MLPIGLRHQVTVGREASGVMGNRAPRKVQAPTNHALVDSRTFCNQGEDAVPRSVAITRLTDSRCRRPFINRIVVPIVCRTGQVRSGRLHCFARSHNGEFGSVKRRYWQEMGTLRQANDPAGKSRTRGSHAHGLPEQAPSKEDHATTFNYAGAKAER